uniref:Uncharacterized protein n=1 Tax=Kalanchoe fedtschenkoi TaxID=63787 RepID=A0A7N0VGI2_KALFE
MAAPLHLILVPLVTLLPIAFSNPRVEIVGRACLGGQVMNARDYSRAFHNITSWMEDQIKRKKMAYGVGGSSKEKVFVYSQCVDDLSEEDCGMCFSQIRTILPGCFPSPGGRVYLDGCDIRVDNQDFYYNSKILDNFVRCGDTASDNEEHIGAMEEILAGLMTNAPDNNGYATMEEAVGGSPEVYGMANCWKNMNYNSCASCLKNASDSARKCLPSTEGRVANSGCFMHYSGNKFANDVESQDIFLVYATYILGAAGLCLTAVGIGFCLGNTAYRKLQTQTQPKEQAMELEIDPSVQERSSQFLQFKYSTLQLATENFNEANKIGQGGYGEVFKGTLKDGREFAIKRLFTHGKSRSKDIYTEMDIISKAQHKNLVHFLGCCFTESESYIVYEYLANKSLDHILFDRSREKKRTGLEEKARNHYWNS